MIGVILRILARPHYSWNEYPWRPMDNNERRAAWSLKYYMMYGKGGH